jgi:hypothetical protein
LQDAADAAETLAPAGKKSIETAITAAAVIIAVLRKLLISSSSAANVSYLLIILLLGGLLKDIKQTDRFGKK